MPRRFHASARFEHFVPISKGHQRALDQTRRWADRWPDRVNGGLVLTGPAGSGKTHLAVSILHRIVLERKMRCRARFVYLPQLMAEIQSTWKDPVLTEGALLSEVCASDILVVDQLGAERTGAWVEERVLQLLTRCFHANCFLVCTTIYPLVPSATESALDERIPLSAVSLLKEACRFVRVVDDYRDTVLRHGLNA